MKPVVRFLRYFEKNCDEISGEIELPELDLAVLQKIFGLPDSNLMYDSFPVESDIADELGQLCGATIDVGRYDYYLEKHKATGSSK